jgi:kynureninase
MQEAIERQWGERLIRSWNEAQWTDMPQRIGAKIARLIGAQAHEVICADSTSINLFKVLAAALHLQNARPRVSTTDRRVILSEQGNFPTDLYVAEGVASLLGDRYELKRVAAADLANAIDESVAVVLLTHVNYRTGAKHALAPLTYRAHQAGALIVWDLAHSAGAVPVDLNGCAADFAIGCGYKYLNGGPGAPAFLYVAERHLKALAEERFAQPLSGWFGHRSPFEFHPSYAPAPSIERFTVGTPAVLGLTALDSGVDTVLAAGIEALREKSVRLTELFMRQVEVQCDGLGLTLVTPRDASNRGSQVCYAHADGWPVMQALIASGVIGDYRNSGNSGDSAPGEPGILRFGFAPLYVRYVDAWDAVAALRDVLVTRVYEQPQFQKRLRVT